MVVFIEGNLYDNVRRVDTVLASEAFLTSSCSYELRNFKSFCELKLLSFICVYVFSVLINLLLLYLSVVSVYVVFVKFCGLNSSIMDFIVRTMYGKIFCVFLLSMVNDYNIIVKWCGEKVWNLMLNNILYIIVLNILNSFGVLMSSFVNDYVKNAMSCGWNLFLCVVVWFL